MPRAESSHGATQSWAASLQEAKAQPSNPVGSQGPWGSWARRVPAPRPQGGKRGRQGEAALGTYPPLCCSQGWKPGEVCQAPEASYKCMGNMEKMNRGQALGLGSAAAGVSPPPRHN